MKIVILDGAVENPGDLSFAPLEELGEVTVYDRTSLVETPLVAQRIEDADVVITNKTPIGRMTIDACPGIRLICVLATGYDVVDYKYAHEKGIPVVNVPAYGTEIVAQYAVALLLEICSHVAHHDAEVKKGRWKNSTDWCFWDYPMIELAGKTAGHETPEGRKVAEYVDKDTLYRESDVIFLHCPLFPETEKMINRETIAKMKDGVIIINDSRGALIDEQALAEALNSGKVYAAGLDVVSTEPVQDDNPLLHAKNTIITPHIAWAAKEARQRILDITADNIRAFSEGKPVNVVNGPF